MDFDKTSFSVDWFTPGDRYGPKRLSFPKSARISIDDLVSDSPLGFCFTPVDEAVLQPHSYSFIDTPFERACGWTNSAPPSPLAPSHREQYSMYDQDPKLCEENSAISPGLLSVINDCALCGVDLDVSCLDALDEQLLLSPMDSFIDLCWEAAIQDEVTTPVIPRRDARSRAGSFKCDRERPFPPSLARDYPGSFERARPLAAKVTLPLEPLPHYLSSFSSDLDTSLKLQEKPLAHSILYSNLEGRLALPAQEGIHIPRHSKKRDLTLTPSFDSLAPPQLPKPCLRQPQSSHALRVISDAYSTFARARRRSPH